MLYYLGLALVDVWSPFNVFRYITFRAAGAGVSAFLLSLWLGPFVIRRLQHFGVGEVVRQDDHPDLPGLQGHKIGTPTMGGLLILLAVIGPSLLWADIGNRYVLAVLAATAWLGFVGFVDDAIKLLKHDAKGLEGWFKLGGQMMLAVVLACWMWWDRGLTPTLEVPFIKGWMWNLGWWYIPFAVLVLVGSSNAVNLTDGLDGLAVGCVAITAVAYAILSYLAGHAFFSDYLQITFVPGSGELAIVCTALLGACLGFLWFNSYPASVFMGDTGALALGGTIGAVALMIKKELLLIIVGGIFVIEASSVLIQIAGNKLTGRRPFLMAPIHHHFQLKGWPENKVTTRFWILAAVFAIVGLVTVKLR